MDRAFTGLLASIIVLSALMLCTSSRGMSPTVDETHYAGLGRYLAEKGDWSYKGANLHPPLPYYMNSMLLAGIDIPEEVWQAPHEDERGRRLFRLGPGDRLLLLTRIPNMVLFLLLVVLVWVEGRRLFGDIGGAAAAFFIALEPNMLAHAGVATPDLPLTAAFFAAVVCFRRFCRGGGAPAVALAGVALGAALLTKYTAVLLIGILPMIALVDRVEKKRLYAIPVIIVIALAVLYAGYFPAFMQGAGENDPAIRSGLPAPYLDGIDYQRAANRGHRAFFLGEVSDAGWPHYYPVAFLAKTPIPLLLLAAAGCWLLLAAPSKRRGAIALLLPPLTLALFFILVSRINIGLRYLLPVYPFLALAAAHGVSELGARSPRFKPALIILVAWMLLGTVRAWPHFLPYFNEVAGGSDGGVRLLADSNLDWGQDLPGLRRWLDRNGYDGAYLAYFGNADPSRYGIRYRYLPGWLYTPREAEQGVGYHPEPEILAISRSVYQGFWLPDENLYRWVSGYPRLASIGHSIDVYDISGDPAVHDKLALIYKRAGLEDYLRDELILGMEEE